MLNEEENETNNCLLWKSTENLNQKLLWICHTLKLLKEKKTNKKENVQCKNEPKSQQKNKTEEDMESEELINLHTTVKYS